ncbi:GIY-YIG nuclease family protein [Empedobacter falsenii]
MSIIKLNDILNIEDISNTKVRFNLMFGGNWNPIEIFKNNDFEKILEGQYWNYKAKKSYKNGQTTIGLIKIKDDMWLLFHIGKITKDLDKLDAVGYEYETLDQYDKYFGRLIIRYKNSSQNMIRNAASVLDDCEVFQILPDIFDNDIFPGYDKVNISWNELTRVIEKETWITALQNQKGVYLITDVSNGKMYVGSAYGNDMLLNRWRNYAKYGNGNNKLLKELDFEYLKDNLRFSILEIFKSTTDEKIILERERWWKETLLTRKFGYNAN